MRRILTALTMLLAVGMTASAEVNFANAPSGTHFTKGNGEPVCTTNQQTNTVSCTGTEFAGVGNTNATVNLLVNGSATVLCHNPGNDNVVTPHTTTASGSTTFDVASTKNGRLTIPTSSKTITTADVTTQFSCPNPGWREEVTDITITGFTYTITFAGFDDPVIELP